MTQCARPWLFPLVPLYAAGAALAARFKRQRRLAWPVISIGNLSAGGSGKTPLTMEVARLMKDAGFGVDILSRGYGRHGTAAARVNPTGTAGDFGDEPLFLAQQTGLPVYVARQRYDAGVLAEGAVHTSPCGLRVHLLDDGMQHRQLHRAVEVVLLSRRDWEDCLLPAGNLREPKRALRRADVLAIPAGEARLEDELRSFGLTARFWRISRRMQVANAMAGFGSAAAAFCGIARPESFFEGITGAGVELRATFAFADHHPYRLAEMERIQEAAARAGAGVLLTTQKDLARLGGLRHAFDGKIPMRAVELTSKIQNAQAELEWLIKKLKQNALPVTGS